MAPSCFHSSHSSPNCDSLHLRNNVRQHALLMRYRPNARSCTQASPSLLFGPLGAEQTREDGGTGTGGRKERPTKKWVETGEEETRVRCPLHSGWPEASTLHRVLSRRECGAGEGGAVSAVAAHVWSPWASVSTYARARARARTHTHTHPHTHTHTHTHTHKRGRKRVTAGSLGETDPHLGALELFMVSSMVRFLEALVVMLPLSSTSASWRRDDKLVLQDCSEPRAVSQLAATSLMACLAGSTTHNTQRAKHQTASFFNMERRRKGHAWEHAPEAAGERARGARGRADDLPCYGRR